MKILFGLIEALSNFSTSNFKSLKLFKTLHNLLTTDQLHLFFIRNGRPILAVLHDSYHENLSSDQGLNLIFY